MADARVGQRRRRDSDDEVGEPAPGGDRRVRRRPMDDMGSAVGAAVGAAMGAANNLLFFIGQAYKDYVNKQDELTPEQREILNISSAATIQREGEPDPDFVYDAVAVQNMLDRAGMTSQDVIDAAKRYGRAHAEVPSSQESVGSISAMAGSPPEEMEMGYMAAARQLPSNEGQALNTILARAMIKMGLKDAVKKIDPALYVSVTTVPVEAPLARSVNKTIVELAGIKASDTPAQAKQKLNRYKRAFLAAGGLRSIEGEPVSDAVIASLRGEEEEEPADPASPAAGAGAGAGAGVGGRRKKHTRKHGKKARNGRKSRKHGKKAHKSRKHGKKHGKKSTRKHRR